MKCQDRVVCSKCGKQLCYVDCFKKCQVEGSYLYGENRYCVTCYEPVNSPEDDIERARRLV